MFKPSASSNRALTNDASTNRALTNHASSHVLRGLYLITNNDPLPVLLSKLNTAMRSAPIALLQYRRKHTPETEQAFEIEQILTLCKSYHVPLIINDSVALADQFRLGVHLGQSDGRVDEARQLLGHRAIIGRTCGSSLALAQQAQVDGASYVAFGAVFPSRSKPEAQALDLGILNQARRELSLPICTIGGLTLENASTVIAQGADLCAVIGDVLDRPLTEIADRVGAWQALFQVQ